MTGDEWWWFHYDPQGKDVMQRANTQTTGIKKCFSPRNHV
jgi:hypothetical protein